MPKRSNPEDFWIRVRVGEPEECWPWTGGISRRGYGNVTYRGRQTKAHRLAWTLVNGPIPEGLHVLHHCDNPPCCNPSCLWLGTNADNTADKMAKKRHQAHSKVSYAPSGEDHWSARFPERTLKGEQNPSAKLTEEDVVALRTARDSGMTWQWIADTYGVTVACVRHCYLRKTWKHVA